MASLNLSINGPSIKSSYNGVVNGPPPAGTSATLAQWALFSVQAPLMNAFQDSGSKESILKVENTGGENFPPRNRRDECLVPFATPTVLT